MALISFIAAPLTALSLIPLLAIGLNYYRYQASDPEARIIDASVVSKFIIQIKS